MTIGGGWDEVLGRELEQPYMETLERFVAAQRATHIVYPAPESVFTAFELTPYERTKVLLLGQDPYHGPHQAHGLCFSVPHGVRPPPSLMNILNELAADVGCAPRTHGDLSSWAVQGVLMLNAVLTVRAGEPNSHKGRGWESFTDAVIRSLNARPRRVVFVLWGAYAQKKRALITGEHHAVIAAAHPSPLSAYNGFFGSRPFSAINHALEQAGHRAIDWCRDRP